MQKLASLLLSARRLNHPAERAAYLAQVCGADASLRQRLESLLTDAAAAAALVLEEKDTPASCNPPAFEVFVPGTPPPGLGAGWQEFSSGTGWYGTLEGGHDWPCSPCFGKAAGKQAPGCPNCRKQVRADNRPREATAGGCYHLPWNAGWKGTCESCGHRFEMALKTRSGQVTRSVRMEPTEKFWPVFFDYLQVFTGVEITVGEDGLAGEASPNQPLFLRTAELLRLAEAMRSLPQPHHAVCETRNGTARRRIVWGEPAQPCQSPCCDSSQPLAGVRIVVQDLFAFGGQARQPDTQALCLRLPELFRLEESLGAELKPCLYAYDWDEDST